MYLQPVFKRYRRPEKEYLSFSPIYQNGERSLDLVRKLIIPICIDNAEVDVWLAGLRHLISPANRNKRAWSDILDAVKIYLEWDPTNSHPLDALKYHSEIFFDPNDDYASSDDDPLYNEDIDYVDASPPDSELVSLDEVKDFDKEDGEIDTDILLRIKDDILREKLLNINLLIAMIKALEDNPTPSTDSVLKSPSLFPNSFLEESDTSDNSLPESEIFCLK
ncbi:hypothetical protein Tco_1382023 [Tanacetum coccineum]